MDRNKLKLMSDEQKVSFLRGVGSWNTYSIKELGIPSLTMSDGPIGIRQEVPNSKSKTSVCYPSGALLACSFDENVFSKLGKSLASNATSYGIQMVLGPAMNIKRSPFGGRGFEYLSEDPYLTYKLASSYVCSMQKEGVGSCIKHYAVNSSEADRMIVNEVVDERTLREIYLYAFERIVREDDPAMIMASYNKVNGYHATENKYLLNDLLRDEFSYTGVICSDWFAVNDPIESINNTLDLEMPNSNNASYEAELAEIKKNKEFEKKADDAIERIVDMVNKYPKKEAFEPDFEKDHLIAKELASESIVLLKNEENILPLKKEDKIMVIGSLAKNPRYQGGGSSHIEAYKVSDFMSSLDGVDYNYFEGYNLADPSDMEVRGDILSKCSEYDKVIFFAGIDSRLESEGIDRTSLSLPENQLSLIEKISKINKNIVVILMSGGPLCMPFVNDVKGVVETYLGGEAVLESLADILYGRVNPSGHLAESFPLKAEDNPSYPNFPGDRYNCLYKEGIYVGYRYYETFDVPVLYPFGFGLSYSEFEYRDFSFDREKMTATFTIKNVSSIKGKAVPQIYISKPRDVIFNSKAELIAFNKVELDAGEEKTITIEVNKDAFSYFNVKIHKFIDLFGMYEVSLRSDAHTVLFSVAIDNYGENKDVPYSKDKIPSYYNGGIMSVSDNEYKLMYGTSLPLVDKCAPYTRDNSIYQAYERGSKGAKKLMNILFKTKALTENKAVFASITEAPIRVLGYMMKDINEHLEYFLDLMNDKHIYCNLIRILLLMRKGMSLIPK